MGLSKLTFKLTCWWVLWMYISEDNVLLPSAVARRNVKFKQLKFVSCRLPALKNGKIKIRNGGRKIRYKCFNPSTLVGTPIASCVHGKWFPPKPPVFLDIEIHLLVR